MRRSPLALAVVAALAVGCSGSCYGQNDISVQGNWLVSFHNMTDGSKTCRLFTVLMHLDQSDTMLTGTHTGTQTGTQEDCTGPSGSYTHALALPDGQIISGRVHGTEVVFGFNTPDYIQRGSGDSLSLHGVAMWRIPGIGDEEATALAGEWTAVRVK